MVNYVCSWQSITLYGKTFEWEKFHGFCSFSANCESFPLNHLLCTVHDGHGLMHRESFPVNSVFYAQPRKFSHSKVLPYTVKSYSNSIANIRTLSIHMMRVINMHYTCQFCE